jgi:hypothetical protein
LGSPDAAGPDPGGAGRHAGEGLGALETTAVSGQEGDRRWGGGPELQGERSAPGNAGPGRWDAAARAAGWMGS